MQFKFKSNEFTNRLRFCTFAQLSSFISSFGFYLAPRGTPSICLVSCFVGVLYLTPRGKAL